MMLKTRVFELCNGRYKNLTELAQVMELSVSQVYHVRENKRNINQKFILSTIKAFPDCRFSDLFYIAPDNKPSETTVTIAYYRYTVALPSSPRNK